MVNLILMIVVCGIWMKTAWDLRGTYVEIHTFKISKIRKEKNVLVFRKMKYKEREFKTFKFIESRNGKPINYEEQKLRIL